MKEKFKMYKRVCRRCLETFPTGGRYSKICDKCRMKRGKKVKNDKDRI